METGSAASGPDREEVMETLIRVLDDMSVDWERESGAITPATRLMADLGCESIDLVMLIVAVHGAFGRQDFPWDRLLAPDGRYVGDLEVGRIADFLHGWMAGTSPATATTTARGGAA